MNEWPYIIGAWAAVSAALVAYVAWILVRGRQLSRQVPPEERRWM
ncbi:MAG: hypothetical protein JJLCMIEE_03523 [Acidimicrobiales bacterium]|nr:MAG: heme exporter protein CcmD [Actinomycetota bacterium]MBV6510383.1 hypothetical protein [Acidimicrobiales bacterium]